MKIFKFVFLILASFYFSKELTIFTEYATHRHLVEWALFLGGVIALSGCFFVNWKNRSSAIQQSVVDQASNLELELRKNKGGEKVFDLLVRNVGETLQSEVKISFSDVLSPGHFGLDDTHMPRDVWSKERVEVAEILPNEEIIVQVTGYDIAEKYDGPALTRVDVELRTYSVDDNEIRVKNFRVPIHISLPAANKNKTI